MWFCRNVNTNFIRSHEATSFHLLAFRHLIIFAEESQKVDAGEQRARIERQQELWPDNSCNESDSGICISHAGAIPASESFAANNSCKSRPPFVVFVVLRRSKSPPPPNFSPPPNMRRFMTGLVFGSSTRRPCPPPDRHVNSLKHLHFCWSLADR
jgi:hypothetical protein